MTDKQILRREITKRRRQANPALLYQWSQSITDSLIALPKVVESSCLMTYLALPGEVNLDAFIQWGLDNDKKIVVPVVISGQPELVLRNLESLSQLSVGVMGIRQPVNDNGEEVQPRDIEFVVTPGVAFDARGGRLGYGGGYYDRLLSKLEPTVPTIGVAFEFQVVDHVPVDAHDRRVGALMTQDRLLRWVW